MTESIETKLVATIGDILPIFLDEAEVEVYPFSSYDMTVEPAYDKDGIYKYVGTTKIYVIAKDFATGRAKADAIIGAISAGMNDQQYVAKRTTSTEKCYEGIWDIELDYTITQHY